MLLSIGVLLAITLLSSLASAQSSSSSTGTSTSSAAAATHTVAVGADGFNYTPNQLNANVGDIIEFRFYPQNHSVARAAFEQPCIPYEDTGPNRVGFWSGFQPVALVLDNPPIFLLPINDTEPVFFYCSAPGACFDGMIGVINPNSTFTFATQFAFSQNATEEFSPMEYFPKETVPPDRTTTATGATSIPTAAATNSATTSSAPAATSSPSSSSDKKSLSTGAIVGIAIGGFAVLVLAAALIYMCGRQKTMGELLRHNQTASGGHNSYVAASPGISEAYYPNMQQKPSLIAGDIRDLRGSGRFSAQGGYVAPGTETESYRSMSPPIDERTGMMQHQMGNLGDPRFANGQPSPNSGITGTNPGSEQNSPGFPSPGFPSPGYPSPGYPSPGYYDNRPQEMEHRHGGAGPRPYNPNENAGPHEMAANSPDPDPMSARPFSFTDSESGYRRDEKTDTPFSPMSS